MKCVSANISVAFALFFLVLYKCEIQFHFMFASPEIFAVNEIKYHIKPTKEIALERFIFFFFFFIFNVNELISEYVRWFIHIFFLVSLFHFMITIMLRVCANVQTDLIHIQLNRQKECSMGMVCNRLNVK